MLQKAWNLSDTFEKQLSKEFINSEWNVFNKPWHTIKFRTEFSDYLEKRSRGVYIISLSNGFQGNVSVPFSSFKAPVYIGHSISMDKRFLAHSRGSYENALWKTLQKFVNQVEFHYKLFPNVNVSDLRLLEQELINIYGPSINKINSKSKKDRIMGSLPPI